MFELMESHSQSNAVIRVIGIGGGGGNALEHMLSNKVEGVEFVCANTDAQALKASTAHAKLQLGNNVTKGLGAGADPEIGRQAALEDRDRIQEILEGSDMIFITAGMGGGTGTGASPIVAQLAKEMGILTVAVVTKPFPFELKRRMTHAEEGIEALSEHVDSLITVPNEKLLSVLGRGVSLRDAFGAANEVLLGAVQGIAELITRPGMINVDFADVRTVMSEKGRAMMGSGRATGEDRAIRAAEAAIACPLLENVNLAGARGILVNVTAGPDMGMDEFAAVGEAIGEFASDNALVVMGTASDDTLTDELRVTVVATGLDSVEYKHSRDEVLRVVRTADGEVDYRGMDTPTVVRNRPQVEPMRTAAALAEDPDYLDIPAFLRRQAD